MSAFTLSTIMQLIVMFLLIQNVVLNGIYSIYKSFASHCEGNLKLT